jgi:hypothetical protein
MPEHCPRSQRGDSEGKPAGAIRIQGKDCDHAQTAATSERAAGWQGFHRHIQRKIVLRISDCDQGPDLGWQSNPVQCLQTGTCGIWSDDESRFCGGNARAPSHSHSGIRRVRSPRGVIREFWKSINRQVRQIERTRRVANFVVIDGLPIVSVTASAICNRYSKIYNRKSHCQGGEIGRRARLRIPKSSISKRSFSFQKKKRFTRGKRDFSQSASLSRMVSRMPSVLAQI